MKLNYWVGGLVIVIILFSNSLGLTQQVESSNNQGRVNESQPNYVIGLRTNAAPISYRASDDSDNRDHFEGYCYAFIEALKQTITGNIKTVSVSRGKRFTGQGDDGTKLDALCGPDTITAGRETTELQKNDLDGKFSNPFAWTSIAAILEKKNKDAFLYPSSQRELKISVLRGTTTNEVVKALYPSLFFTKKIDNSNDFKDAINKLTKGEVIAYFDDEILLRDRLKKISVDQQKEYIIVPIPSIIEYGMTVFSTKEKKNQKLLEVINNLLENAPQEKFDSTTIKILNKNADFQKFINSVKGNSLLEITPTPTLNPTPTLIQGYLWLLVFSLILIFLIIIWLYSKRIRGKTNKPVSPIRTKISDPNDPLNCSNSSYDDIDNPRTRSSQPPPPIQFINQNHYQPTNHNHQGNNMPDQSRKINVNRDLNANNSIINLGEVNGNLSNTIQQLQSSPEQEAPKLADLISQLQTAISDDSNLTEEQKKDALEALNSIGEEAQKPLENRIQKISKFAFSSLKNIVSVTNASSELVNVVQNCLPQIKGLIGL